MLRAMLLVLLLAPAARAAGASCWRDGVKAAGLELMTAVVPASSFRVAYGARTFIEAARLGLVVTNGTFFAAAGGGLQPLGDVVVDGAAAYRPGRDRLPADGERLVDLASRWGLGVFADGHAAVIMGYEARNLPLKQYLGGAGLLLRGGRPALSFDHPQARTWGASFPAGILDGAAARTAVGVTAGGALLVAHAPRSRPATLAALAAAMAQLGAVDAVFYDGGHAAGFAAGEPGAEGRLLSKPHPSEDFSPTHLVFDACP